MAWSSVGGSITVTHWPLAPFMLAMLTVPAISFPLWISFRTTNSAPSAQVPFQVPTNGFRDPELSDCATCNGGRRKAVTPSNSESFVGRSILVILGSTPGLYSLFPVHLVVNFSKSCRSLSSNVKSKEPDRYRTHSCAKCLCALWKFSKEWVHRSSGFTAT